LLRYIIDGKKQIFHMDYKEDKEKYTAGGSMVSRVHGELMRKNQKKTFENKRGMGEGVRNWEGVLWEGEFTRGKRERG